MTGENEKVVLVLDDVSLNYQSSKATFSHGVHNVLDSISCEVYEGETLGIIGRNGCGKSSILRLMAGILAPTKGTVSRKPHTSCSLLTLGLGFRRDLSGRSNALLAAMLQGSSREQAASFLEEIKDFSDLGDSFEEPVKTYSSGMRSRLGFSTSLMTHVDILLIDEVLSVGDAHFKKKAADALRKRITGEQTVVFVSHSASAIEDLCDRVIWLNEGSIAGEGDTTEVLEGYMEHIGGLGG
ncbi:MAG: ABC transporter ATP-binding protein, partial [Halieaceae bacterium]|nr:ABC transporter ATP-binding protein [Halieaceae bacterium]